MRSSPGPAALAALAVLAACRATPPSRLERAFAAQVKRRLTVGGKSEKNPLPPTEENLRAGRRAFLAYCPACHGLDGQGTGVPFAEAMAPPVPSLASPEVQAYADGQLRWVVENGLSPSGMPAARGILREEEIWGIVLWLRRLPPAGSLGEPAPYAGGWDPETKGAAPSGAALGDAAEARRGR